MKYFDKYRIRELTNWKLEKEREGKEWSGIKIAKRKIYMHFSQKNKVREREREKGK